MLVKLFVSVIGIYGPLPHFHNAANRKAKGGVALTPVVARIQSIKDRAVGVCTNSKCTEFYSRSMHVQVL
jgi:hypothetical protein